MQKPEISNQRVQTSKRALFVIEYQSQNRINLDMPHVRNDRSARIDAKRRTLVIYPFLRREKRDKISNEISFSSFETPKHSRISRSRPDQSIYSWKDDKLIHFCAFSVILRFSFFFYSFPLKDPNMNYASKGQVRTEEREGERERCPS